MSGYVAAGSWALKLTSRNGEVRMLGVTPPISLDPPKEADVKASEGESQQMRSH